MKTFKPTVTASFLLSLFIAFSASAQADGGIGLGATRVVYPDDAKQASLPIINNDKNMRYLINSWIENSAGSKERTFVVTPPLFVSEPSKESTLRLVYIGQALPKDRESIYWLNVKAIPSADKKALESGNVLQLAILSRIKVFMRPKGLKEGPDQAVDHLVFHRAGKQLEIENDSAYYISFVNLQVGGKKLDNTMVAPKSKVSLALPEDAKGSVSYRTVNDYGAVTEARSAPL